MTIHDIIVNCGSMGSNVLIIIANDFGEVKWKDTFKNLPRDYEELKIKYFTVGFHIYENIHENTLRTYFKFYV